MLKAIFVGQIWLLQAQVRLPENDGLAERMRRRNVEFELRYGNHRHTMKALETLTGAGPFVVKPPTFAASIPPIFQSFRGLGTDSEIPMVGSTPQFLLRRNQCLIPGSRSPFFRGLGFPGQQEELLQLVVALAFYPNLALPSENNRERCSAECVFHTRHVPFVNLHPSSVAWCCNMLCFLPLRS